MNSCEIKSRVAHWLRFNCGHLIIGFEADTHNHDVIAITKNRRAIEVEVKTSLADLKAERVKWREGMTVKYAYGQGINANYFYFALPGDATWIEQAKLFIGDNWPFAGILRAIPELKELGFSTRYCEVEKSPKLRNPDRLSIKDCLRFVRWQSNTLCSLSRDLALAKAKLEQPTAPNMEGE